MESYEKKYKEALDKAKRYDEVFNAAKEWYNNPNSSNIGKSYLYAVFPELKESEDERIRKGIIRNLEYLMDRAEGFVKDELKERIAWLEKQGEQKSADKVEPKFKVGDWIIDVQGVSANQIIGYEDDSYYIETSCSKFYLPMKLAEKNYRLWTIKDAKAGDVLYSPKGAGVEGIFLIKGWEQVECTGKTLCSSIGYRVEEDEIVVSELGATWWEGVVDPFYPATKEQRNALFAKMKDAGYEWDADKKELKKIEDEIEIPYGSKDSELQEATYYIPKGFYAEIDDDKVVIKKGEKPTEWSEKHIADVFEKVGLAKIVREQSNDALTIALQDAMIELSKVTLQPNPTAWSKEDEYCRHQLISFCENCMTQDACSKRCAHWLKSLIPQNTWKPSDAQMEILSNEVTAWKKGCSKQIVLESLYNDLKKL